jgi:uncharacterized protein (DUF1501 family)
MTAFEQSRRSFLRTASLASMAGVGFSPFLLRLQALAAQTPQSGNSDYKALVCICQGGGNDGHNMLLATDTESFNAYTQARSPAPGLAFSLNQLLPITPKTAQSGRTFALNPYLPGLQNIFNQGRAAFIANAGTLIAPTTKAQYNANSVPLPLSLFSHGNQQAEWMSIAANGGISDNQGWGGSFADLLASANTEPALTCISTSGNALFLAGQTATQLTVSQNGLNPVNGLFGSIFNQPGSTAVLSSILGESQANLFAKERQVIVQRSIAMQAEISANILPAGAGGVLNPTPATSAIAPYHPIDTTLATNLQTVARLIGARSALGVTRQIFFVFHNGYDTHNNEVTQHGALMEQLNLALTYFDSVLTQAGLSNQVTTFTMSDFGRTLSSNSNGTDHGWGNHHIVMGGAVQGNDIYGQFPVIGTDQINDVGYGRLIPTIAVEQYGGTLGRWMGLTNSQIQSVFPNFTNFGTNPYLSFLG